MLNFPKAQQVLIFATKICIVKLKETNNLEFVIADTSMAFTNDNQIWNTTTPPNINFLISHTGA